MAIDARVCGVRIKPDEVALILEPSSKQACAGQPVLVIVNPPTNPTVLESMIGTQIWGDSSKIIVGRETVFAERIGYTRIRLADNTKGGDA